MLIDALSRVAKERELELARIAEEKLEQDRREQEEKRDADIKKFLLVKGLDDKTSSTQVVADQDDLGADSDWLLTLVKAKEIRQHPDAKRIIDRINTRKQRKFKREVEVIERWLEIIGFGIEENSELENDDMRGDIKDVNDELDRERQRMFTESANDDGTSAIQMTDTVVETIGARVNAYIATGIPVPVDDKQVRRAYKRWRIDSAAEGDDSDEDVNILNSTFNEDANGKSSMSMANKMEARKNLQENALAELRRNLPRARRRWREGGASVGFARSCRQSRKECRSATSTERTNCRHRPASCAGYSYREPREIQRRRHSSGRARSDADANLVSMNIRQAGKSPSNNTTDHLSEENADGDGEREKAESSERPASWRTKIRATPSGARYLNR